MRVDHEGVLLLQQAGEVLVINELGMRVIELLERPAELGALVDCLTAEFDVDRPTLKRDVKQFSDELAESRVVECG